MIGKQIAGTLFTFVAGAALAHHSPAPFDLSVEQTLDGVVTDVAWRNPHVYLTLDIDGTSQGIEAVGASGMASLGVSREALVLGERVSVRVNPNRRGAGHEALGLVLTTASGTVLPLRGGVIAPPPPAAESEGLAGSWLTDAAGFQVLAAATQTWPLTEAGERAAADLAGRAAAAATCAPFGPPAMMTLPGLTLIEVTDTTVTFEVDGAPARRVVHLDVATPPAGTESVAEGYSVGRWEGESLVVETTLFAADPEGLGFALPSSTAKRALERFTPGADRRSLVYEATVEDPVYLTMPVSYGFTWTYRPDLEPSRLACDPGNAARFANPR